MLLLILFDNGIRSAENNATGAANLLRLIAAFAASSLSGFDIRTTPLGLEIGATNANVTEFTVRGRPRVTDQIIRAILLVDTVSDELSACEEKRIEDNKRWDELQDGVST